MPGCLCKFSWNLQSDPAEHFAQLNLFLEKFENKELANFCARNIKTIKAK